MRDLASRVEPYLARAVKTEAIPGLTVAIVNHDQVVYVGAFGVRTLGGSDDLTPDHVFHFASVSKVFVATAIAQLAESHAIWLDDPVVAHLPYFRLADDRYRQITIRQMLDHTSGMPDVVDYEWDRPQVDEGAAERYVRSIAPLKLLFSPGSAREYSNLAFDTLGDMIAKVSGVSFEDYVKAHILAPLGMECSSFVYGEIPDRLRTTGHVDTPARVSDVYPYNRRHAPSSTLNSSVAEMVNWIVANLNRGKLGRNRILRDETYEDMWTCSVSIPDAPDIGLGWFLGERAGTRVVSHAGRDTGFCSNLLLLPDVGAGVVMASNWDMARVGAHCSAILDMVLESHGVELS